MKLTNMTQLPVSGSAIVVFTDGDNTNVKYFGESSTGNWIVDKNTQIEYVVIYHKGSDTNTIYTGKFIDKELIHDNRYNIKFDNVVCNGQTSSNWNEFVGDDSMNPVRYLNRGSK